MARLLELTERIARGRGYLIGTVNAVASKHVSRLVNDVVESRKRILHDRGRAPPPKVYDSFLRALYPRRARFGTQLVQNESKYESINHKTLYERYKELPVPRPLHIRPQHLEDFLRKFMKRRDFIRPNAISLDDSLRPGVALAAFEEMIHKRKQHVTLCTEIFEEVKRSGLPMTSEEQSMLAFLFFFKDKRKVLELVSERVRLVDDRFDVNERYNDFNFDVYTLIKGEIDINTLLELSISHEKHDVFSDIVERLEKENTANRRTFEILFESADSKETFTKILDALLATDILVETRMINRILGSMLRLGLVDDAETLFSQVFVPPEDLDVDEAAVYRGLTLEEKSVYNSYVAAFDSLPKSVVHPTKVLPNEGTFRRLITHYCHPQCDGTLQKVLYLIELMETQYDIPITTRVYRAIFSKFIWESRSPLQWSLARLVFFTGKLVNSHELLYNINNDGILVRATKKPSGNVVKLSDHLLELVYQSYIHAIDGDEISPGLRSKLLTRVDQLYKNLRQQLEEVRDGSAKFYNEPNVKNISKLDEVNHLKKIFLLELIEVVSE